MSHANHLRDRIEAALAACFTIDLRALAAFRVGLATCILADLAMRATDLEAFYTDAGVVPRVALRAVAPTLHWFSFHAWNGGAPYQAGLFVAAALAGLALLVGFHTRAATMVSFALLLSLQTRNPVILNAGDTLLVFMLGWSIFLPLGARGSMDARRRPAPGWGIADAFTAGLLLQVALVYFVNALFKTRSGEWVEGVALRYVFSNFDHTLSTGAALVEHEGFLAVLGWTWFLLVWASPLLLLLRGWPRAVLVGLYMGAHLGMLATMRLGLFPIISLVGLLPFVPPQAWDRLGLGAAHPVQRARLPIVPARPRTTVRALVLLVLTLQMAYPALELADVTMPAALRAPAERLGGGWAMFADPSGTQIWYVAPANLSTGGQVDALRSAPVSWDQPRQVAGYPDIRWTKYFENLRRTETGDLPKHLGDHLCRRWNAAHEEPIVDIALYRIDRTIVLDAPDPASVSFLRHVQSCPSSAP